MAQVKAARPLELFSRAEWSALTRVSRWRGTWLVVHCWAVIALVIGGALWTWDALGPLAGVPAVLLAIVIVGGRQLGLAILMHDAAHGLLSPNRRWNNRLGEWLTGAPVGSDLKAYRTYHLTHHRYTQQEEDPDLILSKPFPTSGASLRRKVWRDLTGRTFLRTRGAQLAAAWAALKQQRPKTVSPEPVEGRFSDAGEALGREASFDRLRTTDVERGEAKGPGEVKSFAGVAMLRFLAVNALLLIVPWAIGAGPWPFLIWLAALATTFQLFLRVRNIAEHACTATGSDDPFTHARTTHANWAERATVAPYWVNYHSEHHLFMAVPCYRLPAAHRLLAKKGLTSRMTIAPGYVAVLRMAGSAA
ncbi:fatty acid desaturase family protein [Novosphingopyxis sp. YJ-S2-01]|nr:fatty acid desaturase family protein [Novosphingopyxis sp. YJ-S2-01]MBH9536885.1 fatty acid desaturase family protein [Novosphingopyxis sp. YJ-S2-01]